LVAMGVVRRLVVRRETSRNRRVRQDTFRACGTFNAALSCRAKMRLKVRRSHVKIRAKQLMFD